MVQTNKSFEKGIVEREQLVDQLQEANNQIETLSCIVPICIYCKEIRDDKGYWNQLEEYISAHSSALFSHGICSQCMKEKNPEVDAEDG